MRTLYEASSGQHPTDLAALTAGVAATFRPAIEAARLKLVVSCPPLPQRIRVSRAMWERIVRNLLSNAVQYTFEGYIAVALRWTEDARIELEVRDTGVGISDEELPALFTRNERVSGELEQDHSHPGIGLAMVRQLARAHGGDVTVNSRLGKGTTFLVSMQVRNGAIEPVAGEPAVPASAWPRAESPPAGVPVLPAPDPLAELQAQLARSQRLAEQYRHEAEAAGRARDELLAMVGHQLRDPLAPIVTALQLLRMRGIGSPEQNVLERQVARLNRLVSDLVDVSKLTAGRVELHRQNVELGDVLADAVDAAGAVLEPRRHALEFQPPPRGTCVNADPDRLAQVVTNLLVNAARYSPPGSPIQLRTERDGDTLRIAVRDRGIGLEPDELRNIFAVFSGAENSRASRSGLGLGLAIARNLVEHHGGRLTAHSEGLGSGSEFVVELPASAAPPDVQPPRPWEVHPARRGRGERVLIVDDNEDAALTLAQGLRALGFTVERAPDGPLALAAIESFKPGAALIDIGLPVMDGYELAEIIRQRWGVQLRLVAVSGYGHPLDRRRSLASGFDAHLVKPVELNQVEQMIRRRPPALASHLKVVPA